MSSRCQFCRTAAIFSPVIIFCLFRVGSALAVGQIDIESVTLTNDSGRLVLNADAALELNATIEAGLTSGVPIYFNADVRIKQVKLLWFDSTVFKTRRRFTLVYYELTRHYRVTINNEDRARNFRSLFEALDYIGTIRDMPLISKAGLLPGKEYRGFILLSLDINALPLPLRPQAFVSSAWKLQSEERMWLID